MKFYFCLLSFFFVKYGHSQSLSFNVGGNFTSGNLKSYGINLRSNYNSNLQNKNQLVITPSFDYGVISNQLGVYELRRREILTIVNYERSLGNFKFYIYNEFENSFLRKIRIRGSFGTGLSYKFISSETTNFDISQLVLPEIFQSSFSNVRDNRAVRLSTRIRFSKKFSKYRYSTQFLFQPSVYTELKNGGRVSTYNNTNIRLNNTFELILSKTISIGSNADFILQTYPSYINSNIKPYDTNVNLFIKGNF
jgi:hypothetical protein